MGCLEAAFFLKLSLSTRHRRQCSSSALAAIIEISSKKSQIQLLQTWPQHPKQIVNNFSLWTISAFVKAVDLSMHHNSAANLIKLYSLETRRSVNV